MTDDRLGRLLRRFAAATTAHAAAIEAMDEVQANIHAGMIARLYHAITMEGDAGRAGLLALVESDKPEVAGMAAVYSLRQSPERCLAVLRRLASEPGLMGFRARVVIERWERGEWEID